MTECKNQHYVPKSYFRFFSNDGKRIEIYNVKTRKFFNEPFKHICSEDYFYIKNPELENAFSKIEGEHAKVIKSIIENKSLYHLTKQDYYFLYSFLAFQYTRTKKEKIRAKQVTNHFVENTIKPYIIYSDKKSVINKEDLDDIEITYPADHLREILNVGLCGGELLIDLRIGLLINKTKRNFIFSDAPVIFHNTYFNREKEFGTTGFQNSGLQIFCPLNKEIMLLLFDPDFYEFNSEFTGLIDSESDIDSLNALQFFYCYDNIYFSDKKQSTHIKNLHSKLSNSIKKEGVKLDVHKETYRVYTPNIDYDLTLSFMKSKTEITRKGIVRNPAILKSYRDYIRE